MEETFGEFMNVKQAADFLRISTNTMRALLNTGLLPYLRIGKNIRISNQVLCETMEVLALRGAHIRLNRLGDDIDGEDV